MSIAAVPAAKAVGSSAAAAGGSSAAAAGGSRTAASTKAASNRWAETQAATLRSRGMDDAQIRESLKSAGYGAATAKAAAPSQATRTATPPHDSPAATSDPTPGAAGDTAGSSTSESDRMTRAGADRADYLHGPRAISGNKVGSGLLLGLVLYPVALAFLRDGIPGFKAWFKAKFLNQPTYPTTPGSDGRSGIPRPGQPSPKPGSGAGGGGGESW